MVFFGGVFLNNGVNPVTASIGISYIYHIEEDKHHMIWIRLW